MATDNLTYPNDYRVICDSSARPIVVGGQAVNLWAITFLGNGDPKLGDIKFGSEDLDVLSSQAVIDFLKKPSRMALPQGPSMGLRRWPCGNGIFNGSRRTSAVVRSDFGCSRPVG